MSLFSLIEILNLVIATLVVGYIFTGLFKFRTSKNILDVYVKRFDWNEYWFSCLVAAPGIILHELAHKFVAMGFGLHAFFQASVFGLVLGVILKLLGTGFIILAPGYVVISGATFGEMALSAFAGPAVNLLLWLIAILVLKKADHLTRKQAIFWTLNKEVNKWLFIFNMLPIPPLDGFKVFYPLFKLLF